MNAIILILLRLSGYGGTGLSVTFGALEGVDFVYSLYAGSPATFSEFSLVVALGYLCVISSSELSAFSEYLSECF